MCPWISERIQQGVLSSSLRNFSCGTFQKFFAQDLKKSCSPLSVSWKQSTTRLFEVGAPYPWQLLPTGHVKLGSRQAMRTVEVALGGFEEEPDWHIRFQSNPFPSIIVKPAGDRTCLKVPDPLTDHQTGMHPALSCKMSAGNRLILQYALPSSSEFLGYLGLHGHDGTFLIQFCSHLPLFLSVSFSFHVSVTRSCMHTRELFIPRESDPTPGR